MAITRAAEELTTNANEIKPNVLILTDALSVLEGLKNAKEKCLDPLHKALATLSLKRQKLPYSGSLPTVAFQGMR